MTNLRTLGTCPVRYVENPNALCRKTRLPAGIEEGPFRVLGNASSVNSRMSATQHIQEATACPWDA